MTGLVPQLKTMVLHHSDCLQHGAGGAHQESPARIVKILEAMHRDGLFAPHELTFSQAFTPATRRMVVRAHTDK